MINKKWLDFSLKCLYEDCSIEERVNHLLDIFKNVTTNDNLKEALSSKVLIRRDNIITATKKTSHFFELLIENGFEIVDNYFIKKVDLKIKDLKKAFLFKVEILNIYKSDFNISIILKFPTKINELYGMGTIVKEPEKIKNFTDLENILNNLIYDTIENYRKTLIVIN